jgi:DnaK suppressor protein
MIFSALAFHQWIKSSSRILNAIQRPKRNLKVFPAPIVAVDAKMASLLPLRLRKSLERKETFMNKQLIAELAEELKRKRSSLLFDAGCGEIAPEIVDKRESEIEEHAQADRAANLTIHLKERGHETLCAIDLALDRVAGGTYGICQSCGDEIKPARLKALPTAILCIDCANDKEKKTRTAGNSPILYSRIDFDFVEGET